MKDYSVFDIIGPRMIGPSSSHTAGAARLGKVARKISGSDIKKVVFILYGSFAKTYKGHGTDRALVAGILGMEPNDPELSKSMEIAKRRNVEYDFIKSDQETAHPNTVKMIIINEDNKINEIVGSSIGGGNILITQINGLDVEFTGEYPTLVIRHIDKPGVIADVTSLLEEFGINIAFMKVFRQSRGKDAFMLIEIDGSVPQTAIERIKSLGDEIVDIYLIEAL